MGGSAEFDVKCPEPGGVKITTWANAYARLVRLVRNSVTSRYNTILVRTRANDPAAARVFVFPHTAPFISIVYIVYKLFLINYLT